MPNCPPLPALPLATNAFTPLFHRASFYSSFSLKALMKYHLPCDAYSSPPSRLSSLLQQLLSTPYQFPLLRCTNTLCPFIYFFKKYFLIIHYGSDTVPGSGNRKMHGICCQEAGKLAGRPEYDYRVVCKGWTRMCKGVSGKSRGGRYCHTWGR